MTTGWSSEFAVMEHRDVQATAMAVDSSGVFALLAGKKYLGLKNLTRPTDSLMKFPHQSKHEIGEAKWNPHSQHRELCAMTCDLKVEVSDIHESWFSPTHTLIGHTRKVTSVDWHCYDPHLITSSSLDRFCYVWDLRDTRRPAVTFQSIVGCDEVKWNKFDNYTLATCHGGDIRLWDQRKGFQPTRYFTASESNIHCLEWSPTSPCQLAVGGNDGMVKFIDTSSCRQHDLSLSSVAPIWKMSYTPFGQGILVAIVPIRRRGDNGLLLWSLSSPAAPVHTFLGHSDIVINFGWTTVHSDTCKYQVVTWSKDQTLRLWHIEPYLENLCKNDAENDNEENFMNAEESEGSQNNAESDSYFDQEYGEETLSIMVKSVGDDGGLMNNAMEAQEDDGSISRDRSIADDVVNEEVEEEYEDYCQMTASMDTEGGVSDISDCRLNDIKEDSFPSAYLTEIEALSDLPNVNAINLNNEGCGTVKVRMDLMEKVVTLLVSFPVDYPLSAPPAFDFVVEETDLDKLLQDRILRHLKHIALQRVKKKRSCFEYCIRQLMSTLMPLIQLEEQERIGGGWILKSEGSFISKYFHDSFIPFPKHSGANFCNAGILVVFGRKVKVVEDSQGSSGITPRNLPALGALLPESPYSHSPFYLHDRPRARAFRSLSKQKITKGSVSLYDISCLFPINRTLAEKYVFDSKDVMSMCLSNKRVAGEIGRRDLEEMWSLAALAAGTAPPQNALGLENNLSDPDDIPWSGHPLAIGMIHSMIDYYASLYDIQTAAMLCCAFGTKTIIPPREPPDQHPATKIYNKSLSPDLEVSTSVMKASDILGGWKSNRRSGMFSGMAPLARSSSWSDIYAESAKEICVARESSPPLTGISGNSANNQNQLSTVSQRLELEQCEIYDLYKLAYAEILESWHLLHARAQVMKYVSLEGMSLGSWRNSIRGVVDLVTECSICREPSSSVSCISCQVPAMICCICRTPVRGLANGCMECHHGGHLNHMEAWFAHHSQCPTGCSCLCIRHDHI